MLRASFLVLTVLIGSAAAQAVSAAHRPAKFLLVWSSSKDATPDGVQNPDFLAVVDADARSATYGRVVNTASLPCIPHANLMDELGLRANTSSCILNEAHHLSMHLHIDPSTHHELLFVGGLMSANIFRFDVSDPLDIPQAELVVTSRDVHAFAAVDDIQTLPNGNLLASYMGAKDLTTPGGLVEFSPQGAHKFVREYAAARPGGPARYMPNIFGITDTGLLGHPHGMSMRPDLDLLITADYVQPLSLAKISPQNQAADYGTTIRTWKLSDLSAGPQKIIQVPAGPRHEENPVHNEPEGLMSVSLLNKLEHKGAFTASMCGGALFYTPDITERNPVFRNVFDMGPCTAVGVLAVTRNDDFVVIPIAGAQSPGDPLYDRDYSGEHSRRVMVLDVRPLVRHGNGPIQCGPPAVENDPQTGVTIKMLGHNNEAVDCPIEVASVDVDSALNFSTHGGPHMTEMDHGESRFAFADYFVDLAPFGFPGTGTIGDLKIYLASFDNHTGQAALDGRFADELTGEIGINFNRPVTYNWPNRGHTGSAKPHAMVFVNIEQEDDTRGTAEKLSARTSQR